MKSKVPRENELDGILKAIGQELHRLRLERGYSSHVDFTADHGLPRIQYWRIEKGRANITLKSLARVLAIHGLTIEAFLGEILKKSRAQSKRKSLTGHGQASR